MKIRLITSGGFAGIEQRYEAEQPGQGLLSIVGQLEQAITEREAVAPPSPDYTDGMTYELTVEDQAGPRSYTLSDAADADLMELIDQLLGTLSPSS